MLQYYRVKQFGETEDVFVPSGLGETEDVFVPSGLGIDVPVIDTVVKLGTAVKWVSIGVLALAGATILFKASDLFFGD